MFCVIIRENILLYSFEVLNSVLQDYINDYILFWCFNGLIHAYIRFNVAIEGVISFLEPFIREVPALLYSNSLIQYHRVVLEFRYYLVFY